MIPGFGAHYRLYRLSAALDRLRAMPPGTTLAMTKAATLLGVSETAVRQLVARYAPDATLDGNRISAARLRHAIRLAHDAAKKRT